MGDDKFNEKAARQVKVWLVSFIVFALILYFLRDVLAPFVAAMAIAYFVDPVADRLESKGMSRTVATSVITVVFFALFIGVIATILPVLVTQISGFGQRLPVYFEELRTLAEPLIETLFAKVAPFDFKEMSGSAASIAKEGVQVANKVLQRLLDGGAALVEIVSFIVLTPLVTFYLLRDWDIMTTRIDSWLPRRHLKVIRTQFKEIDRTLAGFVRGQASVCIILGVMYAVALSILGLEFGLLVGLGAGLISFIPYFGAIIGFGVSIAIALVQFDSFVQIALVGGVFMLGQAIEGNFLTPKLVGKQVGLHPVWIIFALMVGGAFAGFTGVLVAVPVAAIIGVLVRFGLSQYLKSELYGDDSKESS